MTHTTTTLSELTSIVQELTARALMDDAHKPALASALQALDRARAQIAERGALDATIKAQQQAAADREHDRRMAAIRKANAALHEADKAYREAALNAALAFRKVLDIARANESVPGASVEHTIGPDIPHLNLNGFRGVPFSTSQQMAMGLMAWERTLAARLAAKETTE